MLRDEVGMLRLEMLCHRDAVGSGCCGIGMLCVQDAAGKGCCEVGMLRGRDAVAKGCCGEGMLRVGAALGSRRPRLRHGPTLAGPTESAGVREQDGARRTPCDRRSLLQAVKFPIRALQTISPRTPDWLSFLNCFTVSLFLFREEDIKEAWAISEMYLDSVFPSFGSGNVAVADVQQGQELQGDAWGIIPSALPH